MSISDEDIINKLLDNPTTLYFMYQDYRSGIDCNLPSFIDRKREVMYLKNLNLREFISSKKMHFMSTKPTKKGMRIFKEIEKRGVFSIFYDIPLDSENSFKSYYFGKMDVIKEEQLPTGSKIGKVLIKNFKKINTWGKISGIKTIIEEISPKEISDDFEILIIKLKFKCIVCGEISENRENFEYDINSTSNNPVKIKCSICKANYMLCPYLNCFYGL